MSWFWHLFVGLACFDLSLAKRLKHFGTDSTEPLAGANVQRTLEILRPSPARGSNPDSCRWRVNVERPEHTLPARWALQDLLKVPGTEVLVAGAVRSSTTGISVDFHGKTFRFADSPLFGVPALPGRRSRHRSGPAGAIG